MSRFRSQRRVVAAVGLLAAAILAFAACGGDDEEEEADPGGGTPVAATLGGDAGEYMITADPESASAGSITFSIVNEGELEHEFEVFDGTLDPAEVPIEEERANFEGLGIEEVDEELRHRLGLRPRALRTQHADGGAGDAGDDGDEDDDGREKCGADHRVPPAPSSSSHRCAGGSLGRSPPAPFRSPLPPAARADATSAAFSARCQAAK